MNASTAVAFFSGLISGGLGLRLIDYGIDLMKQRRQRQRDEAADARTDALDKTRFRVDATMLETSHPQYKTVLVVIKSLGVLPVTINEGDVTIYSSKYPEPIDHRKLARKEISSVHPIEFRIEVKNAVLTPMLFTFGQSDIKLVTKFSYGETGETYKDEKPYNYTSRRFEDV